MTAGPFLGLAEVGELLGLTRQVAQAWNRRGKLPPPVARLRMGPLWLRDQFSDDDADLRSPTLSAFMDGTPDTITMAKELLPGAALFDRYLWWAFDHDGHRFAIEVDLTTWARQPSDSPPA